MPKPKWKLEFGWNNEQYEIRFVPDEHFISSKHGVILVGKYNYYYDKLINQYYIMI